MLACKREIGDHGESERGGYESGLPASIPGTHHDGNAKQGEAAFRDVGQQNGGYQRQRRTEYGNAVAQNWRTSGRNAK